MVVPSGRLIKCLSLPSLPPTTTTTTTANLLRDIASNHHKVTLAKHFVVTDLNLVFKKPYLITMVVLKKGKTQLFKDGSPMVYSGAVDRVIGRPPPKTGDIVLVADGTEKPIGWGLYNSTSMYCVRLMQLEEEVVRDPSCALSMENLLKVRIHAATQLRRCLGLPSAHTNAYRLVNSEGDRPGTTGKREEDEQTLFVVLPKLHILPELGILPEEEFDLFGLLTLSGDIFRVLSEDSQPHKKQRTNVPASGEGSEVNLGNSVISLEDQREGIKAEGSRSDKRLTDEELKAPWTSAFKTFSGQGSFICTLLEAPAEWLKMPNPESKEQRAEQNEKLESEVATKTVVAPDP
ncbi:hypothetical protein RHSIM_Rhsim06G0244000 [Rhododendron simsii]|uniref:PUA domain-containing protein n=1 Tax=Rhododendron simsii TaxID=118357 RepID=A0A834LL06_RHOSS|nr:hypothetical protein RHSIM_Rhsim06G0244000 [Rhododendron simsii]